MKPFPRKGQMIKGYKYTAPISFDVKYGHLASGQFPADCIAECSAAGRVDDSVRYWVKRLNFVAAIGSVLPLVERYLSEYGAWEDLNTADACCDISENGEWCGLSN